MFGFGKRKPKDSTEKDVADHQAIKGGIVFAIADNPRLPIRFIGVGEALEDLRHFEPREFVDALFEQ